MAAIRKAACQSASFVTEKVSLKDASTIGRKTGQGKRFYSVCPHEGEPPYQRLQGKVDELSDVESMRTGYEKRIAALESEQERKQQKLEEKLERKDGRYRIDNNLAENSIRPIACGRKNYLFCSFP